MCSHIYYVAVKIMKIKFMCFDLTHWSLKCDLREGADVDYLQKILDPLCFLKEKCLYYQAQTRYAAILKVMTKLRFNS